MPLVQTRGAASAQGFGEFAQATSVNYIEEVFSCFLYTGTGATQTITNNIDLSTKGGLVWTKRRSSAQNHALMDTARGISSQISSNSSDGTFTNTGDFVSFNTTGYTIGPPTSGSAFNTNGETYVGWTFRKQPKFFDIQTWSGNSTARTIAHNLGSVPGCIMVKRTDATAQDWNVYHQSIGNESRLALNGTSAAVNIGNACWNSTTPTSTVFSLGTNSGVNSTGGTYVAYLFAHDAGGFGLTGTDNVISCGSFNNAVASEVTLGWEPQWLLVKSSSNVSNWHIIDTMRGMSNTQQSLLTPNNANAEISQQQYFIPTATGFTQNPFFGNTTIYIAIRRGPMKVPTVGTSVFSAVSRTGTSANATVSASISPVDMVLETARNANFGTAPNAFDRLRGANRLLITSTTGAEVDTTSTPTLTGFDVQDGYKLGDDSGGYAINYSPYIFINWNFRRAPSFFDEVCYTGSGADPQTVSHNLGVAPELMIFKARGVAAGWRVWGGNMAITEYLALSETSAVVTGSTFFGSTLPTATSFYVGSGLSVAARTHVAYLFATCAGVSKVGSYTGNGTTQTINCGFTGGARFVLIKRTDSTGGWYVYDTARGMTVLTDPYLFLNSTAAEVATLGSVTTVSTGFALDSAILAAINVNAGTYIFLAIA